MKQVVADSYGEHFKIFCQAIPNLVAIAEATSSGTSIFGYEANGMGAAHFLELTKEVLQNEEGQ